MDLVIILRVLAKHRILTGAGIIFAVAVGLLAGRSSAETSVSGAATMRVLLDTTDSQVAEAQTRASDVLASRAALLGDALAADGERAALAAAAGVPAEQLTVLGPMALAQPAVTTPLVKEVSSGALAPSTPYIIDLFADGQTPVIAIEAYAPDRAQAARLAEAAKEGLKSLLVTLDSTGSKGFAIENVSSLRTEEVVVAARRKVMMLAGAMAAFGFWCVALVFLVGIVRRLRGAVQPA